MASDLSNVSKPLSSSSYDDGRFRAPIIGIVVFVHVQRKYGILVTEMIQNCFIAVIKDVFSGERSDHNILSKVAIFVHWSERVNPMVLPQPIIVHPMTWRDMDQTRT